MMNIIKLLPIEIIILVVFLFINTIVLFIFIDKFYRSINYKASFIYYIEFIFNWEKIRIKMKNNKTAKKYFKKIIISNIIFIIVSICFLIEIFKIS